MAKTIIAALRAFFAGCPLMEDGRLNIAYLPEDTRKAGVEYSIEPAPVEEVVQGYMDGGALCQYGFTVRSVNGYGPDVLQNMESSGFYEALSCWLAQQCREKQLPQLPEGCVARKIEAQSTGYLFTAAPDVARYQIQCRLLYYRKGDR